MKQTITLLLFVLLGLDQHAQYVETEVETKKTPKKNAFGVVINPAVAMMLGAGTSGLHYGLQYKRLIQNNRRLRLATYFQSNKSIDFYGVPYTISDTSLTFRLTNHGYQYAEFRFGMEWSDFTKSMDGIYGLEVIAGLDKSFEELRLSERITSQSPSTIGIYQDEISNTLQSETTVKSVVFGIAPIFGYRVNIQEHLELIATISPEIVYSTPITDGYSRSSAAFSDNSGLIFRLRLLDLVLSYRF
jgi:hypothetical protein